MPQLFYKPLEARIAQGKDDARLQAVANAKQQENVRYVNMSDYDKELNRQRLAMFTNQLAPAIAKESGLTTGSNLTVASLDKAIKASSVGKSGVNWKDSKIIQDAVKILTNDLGYNLYPRDFDKMSFAEAIEAVKKADVSTDAFSKAIEAVVSKRLSKASKAIGKAIEEASAPRRIAKAIKRGTESLKTGRTVRADSGGKVSILDEPSESAMRETLGLQEEPGIGSTIEEKNLYARGRGFSNWAEYSEFKKYPDYYYIRGGKYIRYTGDSLKKKMKRK